MRHLLPLLWLAALLLRPAAQDGGLSLSARAGFDGLYKEMDAVPVFVSVRNDGPPIEGEIRIAVDSMSGGPVVYSAPVSLPTGSDKRVALYIDVLTFTGDLNVQLVSDETVVATADSNPLIMTMRHHLLYGVITSDPSGLAFLETVSGSRTDADVAFLDLADLLPVTVGGVESADDLPALSAFGGVAFNAPGPYTLTGSSLRAGELLIHQDGLPILAHTPLGLGGVTFLALDPKLAPLAGWRGHAAVWESIAALTSTPGPYANGIQDGYAATQAASSIPGLRLPSVGQLLLFLFVYTLVIGPINFLVLRRLRRRELAWVTIPVLVLLFSAITFFTSFRSRGGAVLQNEMSVAYGSVEAERVRTQSIVGLYSPQRGRYDLSLPYDTTAFPLTGQFGSVGLVSNLAAIVRAGDLTLREVRADTGEVVAFLVDAHRPRPPLSATARLVDDGRAVAVTVRNDGALTLENAVLLYGDQQRQLDDLAPGAAREAQLPVTVLGPPGATPTPDPYMPSAVLVPSPLINDPTYILGTPDYFSDPNVYARWQLVQSLYNYSDTSPVQQTDPTKSIILAGWLPDSDQPIDLGDVATTRSAATLVLLEIPVR